jgi:hypothetical protein
MILSRHDSADFPLPPIPESVVKSPRKGARLSTERTRGNLASFVPLPIREIRENRGPSSGPYSGCPRTTRFQASFGSLKFSSNATSKPVILRSISHASSKRSETCNSG